MDCLTFLADAQLEPIGASSQDWSTSAKMTASTHGWIHAYHFGSSALPDFCDIRCVLMLDSFQSNSPTTTLLREAAERNV